MINKQDILKMVHHVTKRSRGIPDKRLMHPVREWLIGLLGMVLVVVVGVIYSVHLFTTFSNVTEITHTESAISIRYNETLINEAREQFGVRSDKFNELRGLRVAPPPSPATTTEALPEAEDADANDASEEDEDAPVLLVE